MARKKITQAQRQARSTRVMRWLAVAGAAPVGLVALWISYGHIYTVTLAAGESAQTAGIMALSVDGLMLTAAVAILAGRRSALPYVAFGAGLLASLAANVMSASGTVVSYVVAAWPAVALCLAGELLLRLTVPAPRRRPRRKAPARRQAPTPARSRVNGHRKVGELVTR